MWHGKIEPWRNAEEPKGRPLHKYEGISVR